MKIFIAAMAAVVIGFSSGAFAAPASSSLSQFSQLSLTKALSSRIAFQAAGRKDSHRVSGSGRSGKGGYYKGGRK